jgi:hypothetical protein
MSQYTANLYCNEDIIATNTGDDVDTLYAWMIARVDGNFGDVHGEIIDNNTQEIVKKFQKTYID